MYGTWFVKNGWKVISKEDVAYGVGVQNVTSNRHVAGLIRGYPYLKNSFGEVCRRIYSQKFRCLNACILCETSQQNTTQKKHIFVHPKMFYY